MDHSLEQQRHGYMGHGSPDPNRRTLLQRMQIAKVEQQRPLFEQELYI